MKGSSLGGKVFQVTKPRFVQWTIFVTCDGAWTAIKNVEHEKPPGREGSPIYKEINAYRNKSHEFPAIIGNKWINDANGHPVFVHHFLPTIAGHEAKEDIKLVDQLQRYFEFAANVWLSFSPSDFKEKFPRNFRFTVTVPYTYMGELPPELYGVPQFEVHVVAQDPPPGDPPKAETAPAEKDEAAK